MNTSKNVLVITISIVLAVILLFGGYYIYDKHQREQTIKEVMNHKKPQPMYLFGD